MHALETYLRNLAEIHDSGAAVPETSYSGTLEHLLNEVGGTLKPRVRCIINLRNRGAGLPDGGFFTSEEFGRSDPHTPRKGALPVRGVIEVKGTRDDVWQIARSEQVERYREGYGLVFVTNLRHFLLVDTDAAGNASIRESYRLAPDERAFWEAAARPRDTATAQGEQFTEYLKRVMRHNAPLSDPRDVAWFLASYARDVRARIEGADLPALAAVRKALEDGLGLNSIRGRVSTSFARRSCRRSSMGCSRRGCSGTRRIRRAPIGSIGSRHHGICVSR